MIQTPSKFLKRSFLKSLLENRCVTSSGLEYSENEVRDLLLEKETRMAEQEADRLLRESFKPKNPSITEMMAQITSWQDQLINSVARESKVEQKTLSTRSGRVAADSAAIGGPCESTVYAPSFSCSDTIFSLNENVSQKQDVQATEDR